jgi:hypothetical protein
MARQKDKPSLSEAISRLVQLGLTLTRDQDRQKRRARKMAGDAIDRMGDTTMTADDRAARKRDLLDDPLSSAACELIGLSASSGLKNK